jgi:large subunit ribosomal protein L13
MTKTFIPKNPGEARSWQLVDAADKPLGRLAVNIANALRGKNRPTFDPSVDQGDFVVVVNAEKVRLTGRKVEQKEYSGTPAGAAASRRSRPRPCWRSIPTGDSRGGLGHVAEEHDQP